MENFLSGREHLGDQPKQSQAQRRKRKGLNEGFANMTPESEDVVLKEDKGEGGSRVSYITEEGRVSKIVVTCSCGQITEIDCDYET